MRINQSHNLLKLKLILALSSALVTTSANSALAQNITIDGTLSPAQTLTGPTYRIPQSVGQTVGSNLFQSFGSFSLNGNEAAVFQSGANIRNILSRVTGGSPSIINGLILTDSLNVNLFFINPSGIVFGPSAQLNVGGSTRGSFVASTANALVWSNGSQFSATNPGGRNSLLTIVGDPSGFLFSQRSPQPILAFGSPLIVSQGQSLLLLGGDVSLNNSNLFIDFTSGGRIELGGVAELGVVGLTANGNILSLNFPENIALADVSLTGSGLDARAGNGGSIAINSRNLDILGGSQLRVGIAGGLGDINSQAGDITLNASGTTTIDSRSIITNSVGSNSTGNTGNINVTTDSLILTNGALLGTITVGHGNAGNVNINARDISLDGNITLFSGVGEQGVGNGGDINITAHSLTLTNTSILSTTTIGHGNAGSVNINARNISLDGNNTGFSSIVEQQAVGNSGDINITAYSLTLTNSSTSTIIFGHGNAGSVNIDARYISLDGNNTGFFSIVDQPAVGNSGNINITTNSLALTNGAQFATSSFGQGNSGNIDITTNSLALTNGAQLIASTSGQGNSGNVIIDAQELVSLDGNNTAFFSTVERGTIGNGGSISITTNSLALTNGAQLAANTSGQGNAGNVIIDARDVLFDNGNAFTTVEPGAIGNGGSINITSNSLALTNGTQLVASTSGQGDAGNIDGVDVGYYPQRLSV